MALTATAAGSRRAVLPVSRLSSAISELQACLAAVSALDAPVVLRDDARELLDLFVTGERLCQAGVTLVAPQVDDARDLATRRGTSRGRAKRLLDTADDLKKAPATKRAFERGEVSAEQAEEIAKTEAAVPGTEDELLALAATEPFAELQNRARAARQAAADEDDLRERRHQARSVRAWTDELGMTRLAVSLLPDMGARLVHRLETETQRRWRDGHRDATPQQRMHDALVAFLDLDPSDGETEDRAGAGDSPRTRRRERSRTDLVVVAHADALARGHAHPDEPCHILDGPRLPVPHIKALARDAFVTGVLDHGATVERIVRYGRHIPAELKILLDLGDPPEYLGARCGSCGNRYRLQLDHIEPLAHGGPTSRNNLQTLCPPCHRQKTHTDRTTGLLRPPAESDTGDGERGPP